MVVQAWVEQQLDTFQLDPQVGLAYTHTDFATVEKLLSYCTCLHQLYLAPIVRIIDDKSLSVEDRGNQVAVMVQQFAPDLTDQVCARAYYLAYSLTSMCPCSNWMRSG